MNLSYGSHVFPSEGVSPVLAAFGRQINDYLLSPEAPFTWPDMESRILARLRGLAPRLVGTADRPDIDQKAAIMAAEWLIRIHSPVWLRLAGLTEEAESLERTEIAQWGDVSFEALHAARDAASAAADAAHHWTEIVRLAYDAVEASGGLAACEALNLIAGDALALARESLSIEAHVDDGIYGGSLAESATYIAYKSAWATACRAASDARRASVGDLREEDAEDEGDYAAWRLAHEAAMHAARARLAPVVYRVQFESTMLYVRMIALYE